MLLLLNDILPDHGIDLFAATVDHGLRAEAADEARLVADLCAGLSIPHAILTVDWGAEERPSQSRARLHRYACLAAHARQIDASHVATGHTLDDQAETFLLRQRAGSGWWGLAGIADEAPFPVWPDGEGLTITRPVLAAARSGLREFLNMRQTGWIDDPSNDNDAYERVRLRKVLADHPNMVSGALASQLKLTVPRNSFSARLRAFVDANIKWYPGGAAMIETSAFDGLSLELQRLLLQHLIPSVSGQMSQPRTEALLGVLADLRSGETLVRTLSGCRVERTETNLLFSAELLDKNGRAPLMDGGYWQGRVKFHLSSLEIEHVFVALWDERPVPERLIRARDLPFHIRKSLPVILDANGEILCVPHLEDNFGIGVTDLAPSRLKRWLDTKYRGNCAETAPKESFSV